MSSAISTKFSRDQSKVWYYLECGKKAGQRKSTGIFTYSKPTDLIQKNFNKEALAIRETKKSQLILERQAISSGHIPQHKIKSNFLDYYREFITQKSRKGNRHLNGSFNWFKRFVGKDYLSPIDITVTLCEEFRKYLLENFNGETPANYFSRFKRVLETAKKDGYFKTSPAEHLVSKTKANKKLKDILEADEYAQLMNTPCTNYEVKKAFVFSLYTGFRWADIKPRTWENIKKDGIGWRDRIKKKRARTFIWNYLRRAPNKMYF